ncbi:RES domain-containing protein [Microcella alkaliphila]|uniref:RES domain-containing protein n=1 Tax=Microcella alkaliphila TaxID=279828 RepID=A0A4Q7TSN6_9MICO|nr:RES family NAD+ phosphorylase [Microcella alkaliphila]RZT64024.1 RES domain-containing protein [Microcella alkaliphila]
MPLRPLHGTFYRAVAPEHHASALSGSRAAGRYSRPEQATLYLSATTRGVAAAMAAHGGMSRKIVVPFVVTADQIADLRDSDVWAALRADPRCASASWRDALDNGDTPPSWEIRDRLEASGARGLIDPSRTQPSLWHLVLFRWNEPGEATVSYANT